MRTLVAVAIVAGLGAGPALAQGLPPSMNAPVYGTHAFPSAPHGNKTVFSRLFGSHTDQNKPIHSAEQVSKAEKGS